LIEKGLGQDHDLRSPSRITLAERRQRNGHCL
jgi:hypothetical protein